MAKRPRKDAYITYQDASAPVPHVDTAVRQRSRYGGVGEVIEDSADFFDDPDEPPSVQSASMTLPTIAPDTTAPLNSVKAVVQSISEDTADPVIAASEVAGVIDADGAETFEPEVPIESFVTKTLTDSPTAGAVTAACACSDEIKAAAVGVDASASAAEDASHEASQDAPSADFAKFSQFRNVYESRDGRLCVFEDDAGHLVAVKASRLA